MEWSPGSVRLLALPGGETVATVSVPGAVGTGRTYLGLFSGPVLKMPTETREPFMRLVADQLEPAPRVPGEAALSADWCRAHAGGVLTVIEKDELWVLGPSSATWMARRLPAGIAARDVSVSPDGTLWVAGGERRAGAPEAAILVRLGEHGDTIIPVSLSARDRRSLAKREADRDYWRVDMEGTPAVMLASCAWMYDDPTDFAVIGWDAEWSVLVAERRGIVAWVRDSGVSVYTSEGKRYRVAGHGERPRLQDLRPAIRAAWPGGARATPGDLAVRAACARGNELLLLARVYDWGQPEPHHIKASVIFHSVDDGESFHPWAQTVGSDVELRGVVWL